MAGFECAVNIREDRLNVELSLAATIATTCCALGSLNFSGSGNTGSRDLTALATRRRSALALLARAPPAPAPLHEALLQIMQPEGNLDVKWVCLTLSLFKPSFFSIKNLHR